MTSLKLCNVLVMKVGEWGQRRMLRWIGCFFVLYGENSKATVNVITAKHFTQRTQRSQSLCMRRKRNGKQNRVLKVSQRPRVSLPYFPQTLLNNVTGIKHTRSINRKSPENTIQTGDLCRNVNSWWVWICLMCRSRALPIPQSADWLAIIWSDRAILLDPQKDWRFEAHLKWLNVMLIVSRYLTQWLKQVCYQIVNQDRFSSLEKMIW